MKKRLLSGLLIAVMLFSASAVSPVAAETAAQTVGADPAPGDIPTEGTTGDCTWKVYPSDGVLTISGNGRMEDYSNSNEAPWKEADKYLGKIKTVFVSGGVTYVGNKAFYRLTGLKSVNFANSVEEVGSSAFMYCSALSNITFGKNFKKIGFMAFDTSGISEITIPGTVEEIRSAAFCNCPNLKTVTISDSCTASLVSTFSGCTSLESVTIGKRITEMSGDIFADCPVKNFYVTTGNRSFAVSGKFLCSADLRKVYSFCNGLPDTTVTVPSTVTAIQPHAFQGNSNAVTVNLPDGLQFIGTRAFYRSNVTNINFPDSLFEIEEEAFDRTPWYDSQPDGLIYAGKVAFKLKGDVPQSVTIKSGTLGIAGGAFEYCGDLKSVSLPKSLKVISNDAFLRCTGLSRVTLPANLTAIRRYAFYGCTGLTGIDIPDSVYELGDLCFCYCSGLEKITLGKRLREIPRACFSNCTKLTGDIIIPKSVQSVGWHAFEYGPHPTSFTITNKNVTLIDERTTALGSGGGTGIIYGYAGSTAESYAKSYSWKFKTITEIRGDVNFDGRVDVRDVTSIRRDAAEFEKVPPQGIVNGDMTKNNQLDIEDASVIQRYLAEFTDTLP